MRERQKEKIIREREREIKGNWTEYREKEQMATEKRGKRYQKDGKEREKRNRKARK